MSNHTTTCIPVNDEYAALVGKAVYVFSYYESTIIQIAEKLEPGFLNEYCRVNNMTSGAVKHRLKIAIQKPSIQITTDQVKQLMACYKTFSDLIVRRNALVHAHPITATDGSQILAYQARTDKPIADIQWPASEIESIIADIDSAAIEAGQLFEQL